MGRLCELSRRITMAQQVGRDGATETIESARFPKTAIRYHVEQYGSALFHRVCKMDLEGVVAKHSFGPYTTEPKRTTWFKIRNPKYSQMEGREELFERERRNEPTPGWHSCELACAELE